MNKRKLGSQGLEVSAIGLGCMGMTPLYGTPDPEEAKRTIHAALDAGVTMIDTADAYNGGKNETLVGEALKGRRDQACLVTKFGNIRFPDGTSTVSGKPEYVQEACDKSLGRLGVDTIDLYFVHRIDTTVPIEDTIGAMTLLVEVGKVRHIGLSEAGEETIRRAHAVHPITAVQTEYSLATREVENSIFPVCDELDIGFVAYSPLSRGLMAGKIRSLNELTENDRRRAMPRFQGDNLDHNLQLVDALAAMAGQKGISIAALCIAWVMAQGDSIVPIPGCSRRETLNDCLQAQTVEFSADDIKQIEQASAATTILGTRYPEKQMERLGL
jgi:aryl-alcohol dehydrogenase-like predicted oxidoreductase